MIKLKAVTDAYHGALVTAFEALIVFFDGNGLNGDLPVFGEESPICSSKGHCMCNFGAEQ